MKNQLLVLVVGHNASGKSTLSKKIINELNINRVNGDIIRDLLISSVNYYNGTIYSYPNPKIKSVNKLVANFRFEIIKELFEQGQSVIVDGGGITKEGRLKYIDSVKKINSNIKTVIIETFVDEEELLKRLAKRVESSPNDRWVDFYHDIRKDKSEKVIECEADLILKYTQYNADEIIEKLGALLNT